MASIGRNATACAYAARSGVTTNDAAQMLRGSDASDAEAEARQLALGPPNELAVLAALGLAGFSHALL